MLEKQLAELRSEAANLGADLKNLLALEEAEILFLGRKGRLAELMRGLKDVSAETRPALGQLANEVKNEITEIFAAKRHDLEKNALANIAEEEWIDVSEPGQSPDLGTRHLVAKNIEVIAEIFAGLGFTHARYPEVDWDWFAFEALNMPPTHPARDDWETFFMDVPVHPQKGKMILTPHTSNGQIHEMTSFKPPIRLTNIGKCYRRQSDVTHTVMFHQFEGLVVDTGISVTDLKGTIEYFAHKFFGPERTIRLRPHHFRFTEPSFEIDVSCDLCLGTGERAGGRCRMCKEGWLELGGAGMVHPNVFKACGIDAKKYTGFAFGWGVERTLMMKAGVKIPDLRELYKNDLRFLKQF